jgi:hypothetical protein
MRYCPIVVYAVSIFLTTGCETARVIRSEDLPLYGSSPLLHTMYIGSDPHFHHFVLQRGKAGDEVLVRRDEANVKPATFPIDSRRHSFVRAASPGIIELVGVGDGPEEQKQNAMRAADYLDVLEAVFRHQFDHNASGGQKNVDFFFLSVDASDPPADLLSRFAGHYPEVLPLSHRDRLATDPIRHRQRAGRGIIFRIERATWENPDSVVVEGGYREASESSSGSVYHVERKNGSWVVVRSELMWIS